MLRQIALSSDFRSLATQPFSASDGHCVLGRRTVIYGRNGSGKTTFSEALRLAIRDGDADGAVVTAALRQNGSNSSVRLESNTFPWRVFVYNRHYVHDSLSLFLDGAGGSPTILKMGEANVAAARNIGTARANIAALRVRSDALANLRRVLERERTAVEQQTKTSIISALNVSDSARYNTTRFQVTRARALLNDTSLVALTDDYLTSEVAAASAPLLSPIDPLQPWPAPAENLKRTINDELLALSVESQVLPVLAEHQPLSDWIESGLELHEAGDTCKFCQSGAVSAVTLDSYRRHFSDALNALRVRLQKAIGYLDDMVARINEWSRSLPAPEALLSDHRASYVEAKRIVVDESTRVIQQIDIARSRVASRLADPLTPLAPDKLLDQEFSTADVTELARVVEANQDACSKQHERKKLAQTTVEEHYGASEGATYRRISSRLARLDRAEAVVQRRITALALAVTQLEQAQEDTSRMAIEIDADVRNHFGHDHLRITVTDDHKGYVVTRDSMPAKRLSEGERNAIAFAYFLRTLEADGVDPASSVVVIDDPVTSMDKESLFAGFALAEERTQAFAQVIVLTHDYEYFRLQLRQRANARRKSNDRVRNGDANELAFPVVSVLEMVATVNPSTGRRASSLRKMPDSLLRHPSEYHYLFFRVGQSILTSDPETLPLMGNAARRLLEGFISFRAPAGDDFQQKVDAIQRQEHIDAVLARRVVKFLHGMSHRDEPRPTSALDFPSVEQELRASLEFMHVADPKHFKDMCNAVGLDYLSLAQSVGAGGVE